MEKVLRYSLLLIVLLATACFSLRAQGTFSRFDFNATPFTDASIGPNGIALDADVVGDGMAVYIAANCGGTKGLDLTIPNTAGLFDKPEMGMTFRFRKLESRSDFFLRGGTSFYQTGGTLYVRFRTSDGAAGFIDYGPFDCGYMLDEDNLYHEYTFIYTEATGIATVSVDGIQVWSNDGPDNRAFYWTGDPDPVVGTVMDGNCNGVGILDYAYFFTPFPPLKVEFESFTAAALGNTAELNWLAVNPNPQQPYTVERSKNGFDFVTIAEVAPEQGMQATNHTYTDAAPGSGRIYYRIRQQDEDGTFASTEIQEVTLAGMPTISMQAWPNPVVLGEKGVLNVEVMNVKADAELRMYDLNGRLEGIGIDDIRDGSRYTIDVSGLSPGIYLLRCDCDGANLVEKIVIR